MTRRKAKSTAVQSSVLWKDRFKKLLALGWIKSESEIPSGTIPVDPDRLNLGGSYFHPTYYEAVQFTCVDCGTPQTWAAEDQRWYYETTGAPYYATAKRCRPCRQQERVRKSLARRQAGHSV